MGAAGHWIKTAGILAPLIRHNTGGKTAVIGALERKGQIRTVVSGRRTAKVIQKHIREHVQAGSAISSDEFADNYRMDAEYKHEIVNHAVQYVNGQVHCNGVENFWSLLKRALGGTYVSVEPFHLFRYVDEQAFRFNNRKDAEGEPLNDSDRFVTAMRQIVGKRLTYKQLTGKEEETSAERSEDF
jgi:transposase-like protein